MSCVFNYIKYLDNLGLMGFNCIQWRNASLNLWLVDVKSPEPMMCMSLVDINCLWISHRVLMHFPSAWPRPTCLSLICLRKKVFPPGFILPIRDIRASIGAGFIYPLVGTVSDYSWNLMETNLFFSIYISTLSFQINLMAFTYLMPSTTSSHYFILLLPLPLSSSFSY